MQKCQTDVFLSLRLVSKNIREGPRTFVDDLAHNYALRTVPISKPNKCLRKRGQIYPGNTTLVAIFCENSDEGLKKIDHDEWNTVREDLRKGICLLAWRLRVKNTNELDCQSVQYHWVDWKTHLQKWLQGHQMKYEVSRYFLVVSTLLHVRVLHNIL